MPTTIKIAEKNSPSPTSTPQIKTPAVFTAGVGYLIMMLAL